MKLGNRGFSLIELIIVIAVIAIGSSIATMNFNQWMKKSNIEQETRELYSDLNEARLQSIYTKRRHSIVLKTTNNYVLKQYSSLNEATTAGTELQSKTTKNQMTKENGDAFDADTLVLFNTRGFTSNVNTIRINPMNVAAFDCVIISEARTNLGKMGTSNVCSQK